MYLSMRTREIAEQLQTKFSWIVNALLFIGLTCLASQPVDAGKCLFISSYHQGYAWSDGVERGVRSTLRDKCEIKQFDMDTKRHKNREYAETKALEAKSLIDTWLPDVVITADDNAAKYIIQKYYKNAETPFVFCGVNWTAKEYGFPYSNVTGIIEVAPLTPLLEKVQDLLPRARRALYIGANTTTEKKNFERFEKVTARLSIHMDSVLADTVEQWIKAYKKAQLYDFIIVGSNAGIPEWDESFIIGEITPVSQKLSVTSHEWMMPYSMLGFTKIAEEQGELAAMAALSILDGVDIAKIAIVPNRKWDIWTNSALLDVSGMKLSDGLLRKSKQIQ
jgi:hypothetical protein